MKVLRLVPLALVLVLSACSSVKNPLTPYRIDVQQGNALEQESVEKLKLGLTRSQVRFLLGTPLLVDPFHTDRWDYVYNYRKGGKLTEERRLVLYFNRDVLVRIEAEGFAPKGEAIDAEPVEAPKPQEVPVEPAKPAVTATAPVVATTPTEIAKPVQPAPVPAVETAAPAVAAAAQAKPVVETAPASVAKPVQPAAVPAVETAVPVAAVASQAQAKPAVATEPAASQAVPVKPASSGERSLNETSIVQPIKNEQVASAPAPRNTAAASETRPEPVALQTEGNVAAIKPDVMPEFPNTSTPSSPEEQVVAALDAWAKAWRTRDEEAYLAAYAANYRPEGGESRAEWEKRRRLLLGLARNIDLKIDGVATEIVTEDRAQVSFRQFYRSDSYQDAVIKQIKFVRVDNLWLIEEEKVLAPIRVKK